MKNIKIIVHDWDDTITNSFETYSGWYGDFAGYHDLPISGKAGLLKLIKKNWGKRPEDICQEIWGDATTGKDFSKLFNEFINSEAFDTLKYTPQPFEGIATTLSKLREKYVLGILSSANHAAIVRSYTKHIAPKLSHHNFVIAKEHTTYHKPDPKVFDHVFETINNPDIKEEHILYVGDNLFDYFAARDRGIPFIAVTSGVTTRQVFLKNGLDINYILKSFNELPHHLKIG